LDLRSSLRRRRFCLLPPLSHTPAKPVRIIAQWISSHLAQDMGVGED